MQPPKFPLHYWPLSIQNDSLRTTFMFGSSVCPTWPAVGMQSTVNSRFCFPENAVMQQRCAAMVAKAHLWSHYLHLNLFRIPGMSSNCDVPPELQYLGARLWSLHRHTPGERAHLLNLSISEQMKPATLQSHDWIRLHTLKPDRHKEGQREERPQQNKLTWTWMLTRLDKQNPRVSFVLLKLHPKHNLNLAFSFWFYLILPFHIFWQSQFMNNRAVISNHKPFVLAHLNFTAWHSHIVCPSSPLQTVERAELNSATCTLRLLAVSSPENSTAGQLGSETDTTAQSRRREVLTNRRVFPPSRCSFTFSKWGGSEGSPVSDWTSDTL